MSEFRMQWKKLWNDMNHWMLETIQVSGHLPLDPAKGALKNQTTARNYVCSLTP